MSEQGNGGTDGYPVVGYWSTEVVSTSPRRVSIRTTTDLVGGFRRAEVFVGGWRVGTFKTAAGAARRAAKEAGR